jgi:cobalt/nickel transport system ATP-binding protein
VSSAALELRQVSVSHEPGGPATLVELTFTVAPGERVALIGLNGSGKTTLLMTAVGLVPHQGEIFVAGEQLRHRTLSRCRERIGFLFNVPEDQLLFPKVIDDIAFGLIRRGVARDDAMAQASQTATLLGLADVIQAPVHHLSHGQKQRVALAGALVARPQLLLLDEPSAALDPPGRRSLADVLRSLEAAMLIATHDLDFATSVCARFLMLDRGSIVYDGGEVGEIKRRWEL